jgi:hypothetical protein
MVFEEISFWVDHFAVIEEPFTKVAKIQELPGLFRSPSRATFVFPLRP